MNKIKLYKHPNKSEKGRVEIVAQSDDGDVVIRCKSLQPIDRGVIYSIEMEHDELADYLEYHSLEAMEGCIVRSTPNKVTIISTPDEEPIIVDQANRKLDTSVPMLSFSRRFWSHQWGQCNCVHHGGRLEPITLERLAKDELPWWEPPLTPYQLDILDSLASEIGMHVLDDRVCPRCQSPAWVIEPAELPVVLPSGQPASAVLCPPRSPVDGFSFNSVATAWQLFSKDEHNAKVIKDSKRQLVRCHDKERERSAYQRFHELIGGTRRAYTVRSAFLLALPKGAKQWSALNLEALQAIDGLEDLELPQEVQRQAGIDIQAELDEHAGDPSLDEQFYLHDEDIPPFVEIDEEEELLAEAQAQGEPINPAELRVIKPEKPEISGIPRKQPTRSQDEILRYVENLYEKLVRLEEDLASQKAEISDLITSLKAEKANEQ